MNLTHNNIDVDIEQGKYEEDNQEGELVITA